MFAPAWRPLPRIIKGQEDNKPEVGKLLQEKRSKKMDFVFLRLAARRKKRKIVSWFEAFRWVLGYIKGRLFVGYKMAMYWSQTV